jgi:hypothetical protein
MTRKEYLLLYLISTFFFSLLTLMIREPGYMDAEYYYAGGIQIASGQGNYEPYIWNYLSQPETLPVPSFSYWMPFTSIVASAGMGLLGSTGFYAARLLFVLLAGIIPVLSAWFANTLFPFRGAGWLAGCSAIFCVYYLPYLTITDSFTPIIVLGGLFILAANKIWQHRQRETICWYPLLGILAGLINLTRADGLLWLLIGIVVILVSTNWKNSFGIVIKKVSIYLFIFTLGYFLAMSGWYIRNLKIFETLLPPGNGRMIWATSYNDLFIYSSNSITPQRFFDLGMAKIVLVRLSSLWSNLKSLLAVNGSIVLVPLIVAGFWVTRKQFITRLTLAITITSLLVMSIVFPYAGYRGGFFHSNSAVQIIYWALVPVGLNVFIDLGVKYRKWVKERAWKMFGVMVIVAITALSVFNFIQKITDDSANGIAWNDTIKSFIKIDEKIMSLTSDEDSVIMVNDPPGYFLATNRRAIVNPSQRIAELLLAADMFNARFTVLDANNEKLNADLLADQQNQRRLKLISNQDGVKIYEITQQ